MNLDALVVTDEYDSRELTRSLIKNLVRLGFSTQTVSKNFFKKFFDENLKNHTTPFLFFADSSIRHACPLEMLLFHRNQPQFPVVTSENQEFVTINPSLIDVLADGRISWGNNFPDNPPFTYSEVPTSRLLPPVDPVHILVMTHNRDTYLKLSMNSILFSFGNKVDKVPITILLNDPTPGVEKVVQDLLEEYPSIGAIKLLPNTYMGIIRYALCWLKENNPSLENILIYEDDFILPSSVKDMYPNWPWWFSHRLKFFDLVCWSPSLDNLSLPYQNHNTSAVSMDLNVDRNHHKGSIWINSNDNYNIFTIGSAVGCSVDFYKMNYNAACRGAPTDDSLHMFKQGISTPILHGYHIGWNQEQDGYPKLNSARWGFPPEEATLTDVRTGKSLKLKYEDTA